MYKQRIVFDLPESFMPSMDRLRELNPTTNRTQLILQAIKFAADSEMMLGIVSKNTMAGSLIGTKKAATQYDPEDICRAYGGEASDGMCHYFRYEKVMGGAVAKDDRALALAAIKANPDEFKKMAIPGFKDLAEAEAAYKENPLY